MIAYNYAKALVELAQEQNLLVMTRQTAEKMLELMKISEWTAFLTHPKVPSEVKKNFIKKLLLPDSPQEYFNFFDLIIDRRREHLLTQILEAVIELTIIGQGYEIVKVISAQLMTEDDQATLVKKLEKLWQIKIHLEYRQNPNLIGGIIIQRGDRLYDGSLSGQLKRIKDELINN